MKKAIVTTLLSVLFLNACEDGDDGDRGLTGAPGQPGVSSLVVQTDIPAGDVDCPAGCVQIQSGIDTDGDGILDIDEVTATSFARNPVGIRKFNRIATYPVCLQIDATCDDDTETVAEISAASTDGLTVIYTDSPGDRIGFVNITNPSQPSGLGFVDLAGEPTSVATAGDFVLVGVNTSADFINTSGTLDVVNIATQTSIRSIDVGGQPDSVAVSPDGTFAVVAIENERDEDLGDGRNPQAPAGNVVIVSLTGAPADWTTSTVDLDGVATLFPSDPEPEYVDINENNVAVVTLQENNHIVLIDLATATVTNDFSAGSVDLTNIDATEEDPALISLSESQTAVVREPDSVSWIDDRYFVTADEGDLDGGSRGFTIFDSTDGSIAFTSGNTLDHLAVSHGHYPDGRSGNKGNEPENVEVGEFGPDRIMFVNSERSSLVFVYNVNEPTEPELIQVLPAAAGPEGALAITERGLLVVSSEEDNRGDKLRGGLNIYQLSDAPTLIGQAVADAQYPTLVSRNDATTSTPIPWSAMSGLAADPNAQRLLYAVEDSFYQQNRIFTIDISSSPAELTDAIRILDTNDVLAGITVTDVVDTVDEDDATRIDVFDDVDLRALINADKSINIDPEGVAVASDGGFWVVSEGSGTVGDANRPVNSANLLIKTTADGVITQVEQLPPAVAATQLRFGFEGVTEQNGNVYVAFQREWNSEANVRIGVYNIVGDSWIFFNYPLDTPASQNGGWVGLSDITGLGNNQLLVLERDNQGGPDAAIKRLYRVDVTGLADGALLTKTLVRDLMTDLAAPGGLTPEKVEGAAVTLTGDVWIINDNDGVDDNSGETQLLNLGDIL